MKSLHLQFYTLSPASCEVPGTGASLVLTGEELLTYLNNDDHEFTEEQLHAVENLAQGFSIVIQEDGKVKVEY